MIKELIFSLFHIKAYSGKESLKSKYFRVMYKLTNNPKYFYKYQEEIYR